MFAVVVGLLGALTVGAATFEKAQLNVVLSGTIKAPETPLLYTYLPSTTDTSKKTVTFKAFKCFGSMDVFFSAGKDKEPTPAINNGQILDSDANIYYQLSGTGPGTTNYNFAVYAPATAKFTDKLAVADVVVVDDDGTNFKNTMPNLPGPEGSRLRLQSKTDRTNIIEWTASDNPADEYAVYHSPENLPLVPFDGRVVDTACGAEMNMNLLGKLKATTAGETMTFTVMNVSMIQTVVVVATRAGGYKATTGPLYLTVQGGPNVGPRSQISGTTSFAGASGTGAAGSDASSLRVFSLSTALVVLFAVVQIQ